MLVLSFPTDDHAKEGRTHLALEWISRPLESSRIDIAVRLIKMRLEPDVRKHSTHALEQCQGE